MTNELDDKDAGVCQKSWYSDYWCRDCVSPNTCFDFCLCSWLQPEAIRALWSKKSRFNYLTFSLRVMYSLSSVHGDCLINLRSKDTSKEISTGHSKQFLNKCKPLECDYREISIYMFIFTIPYQSAQPKFALCIIDQWIQWKTLARRDSWPSEVKWIVGHNGSYSRNIKKKWKGCSDM